MDVGQITFDESRMNVSDRLAIVFDVADGDSDGKARAVERFALACGMVGEAPLTTEQLSSMSIQDLARLVAVVGGMLVPADDSEDRAKN